MEPLEQPWVSTRILGLFRSGGTSDAIGRAQTSSLEDYAGLVDSSEYSEKKFGGL